MPYDVLGPWTNQSSGGGPPYLSAANLDHIEDGVAMAQGGHIPFSTFSGADDDAKLAAAVLYVSELGNTVRPTIVLDESRDYTFNDQCPDLPHGFSLSGPLGAMTGNPEQGKDNSQVAVKINYAGTWINPSVTKWNIRISNIDFTGTSSTVFLNSPTQTLWCMHLHNLSFNLFSSVIGTPANKAFMTGCQLTGRWDVANSYDTAFHFGGSDNDLFMGGMYIDSGVTSGVTDGTPHIHCDYMSKSTIGPIYSTSLNNWTGLLVSGSSTYGQGLTLGPGARIEGKNNSEYCRGATIRVNGGSLTIFQCAVNFGMGASNARGDAGTIHHAGGNLSIFGMNHARADGVSQDTPVVYSTGGRLEVHGIDISTQGGNTWTDRPLVYVGSGANLVHADASVRVDPIKERPARFYAGATAPTNPRKGDMWANADCSSFQIYDGSTWGTTRVS